MMTLDIDTNENTISIHKVYPIESFNWTLEFIFNQGRYSENDVNTIISKTKKALNAEDLAKLPQLFQDNTYNSAITISDKQNKTSYIILSQVTTIGQFANSLLHEILHLSRHIDECANNEELFTILGNITGDITNTLYKL